MTPGELDLARLGITLLTLAATIIPAAVGASALCKWNRSQQELRDWDELQAVTREMKERHFQEGERPGLDAAAKVALAAKQKQERAAAGVPESTYLDGEVRAAIGERPRQGFQAPAEVWLGLLALVCAAAAGIWGTWLP